MREFIQFFLWCVECFFVLYMIGYASFLFLSVTVGSSELYAGKRRSRLHSELAGDHYVPVSLIVPAYNEGVTIASTICSLLALDYNLYEIIVVDDGSSDDTAQTVIDTFDLHAVERPVQRRIGCQPALALYENGSGGVPITLVKKQNDGKADALNMGINVSHYPYFLCIDADSVLQHDSLEKIVRPVLEDDTVVAVGGAVRPANGAELRDGRLMRYRLPQRLLVAMQVLEYDRSFLASRILFDKFNGNIIISGAFGLFKKKRGHRLRWLRPHDDGRGYGALCEAARVLSRKRAALSHSLRGGRRLLDAGPGALRRSLQAAAALAHRAFSEHDEAPPHSR